jgi:predicted transcriptional regulator
MALARELRELRVASGLSLCELSRPCDVSDECIRLIESGECVPTMDRAARIAVLAGLGFRLRIPRDA